MDSSSEEFEAVLSSDDEEIPTIDEEMISREVDFEEGMNPFPVVSVILGAGCAAAFVCQVAGNGLEDLKRIVEMGALSAEHVVQGEVWRMISAGFLHGSLDHILGNLIVLYILGMGCEHAFGRGQMLFLYVVAMISGSLFSLTGGRVSVGASGAIFGLVGGLVALFMRHRSQLVVRDHRIGLVLLVWAGYQFLIGTLSPAVDNLCHLGGFVAGFGIGFLLQPALLMDRRAVAGMIVTQCMVGFSCTVLLISAFFFVPRLISVF